LVAYIIESKKALFGSSSSTSVVGITARDSLNVGGGGSVGGVLFFWLFTLGKVGGLRVNGGGGGGGGKEILIADSGGGGGKLDSENVGGGGRLACVVLILLGGGGSMSYCPDDKFAYWDGIERG
jgi:hypothetical protein